MPSETALLKFFRLKREALQWGRDTFDGVFIVEPINKAKLSERLDYLKNQLGIVPELAYTGRSLHPERIESC
jgi:hypothetical protein